MRKPTEGPGERGAGGQCATGQQSAGEDCCRRGALVLSLPHQPGKGGGHGHQENGGGEQQEGAQVDRRAVVAYVLAQDVAAGGVGLRGGAVGDDVRGGEYGVGERDGE
ncbi:hypothetical protein [Streptomyces sp. NPDC050848]|uniref:hypothetical protein n=1 Tax=Streptomyces sp. NPDC050848 TaxID=3155791 RepID=UPI0033EF82AE